MVKQRLVNVLCFLCYWLGIDRLFYFLNRRAKRIITFHNILPDDLFRRSVANGVSNSLGEFELIVNECARRYKFSTDLFDTKTVTITFDDGYRNQYTTAFKYLCKRGIPAYLFVSGGILSPRGGRPAGDCALLIDKLLHLVSEAPIECIPGGDRLQYWVGDVWPRFMADGKSRGRDLFDDLTRKYPYEKILESLPEAYVRERLTGIELVELDEMRKAGWKIGWHTKSHYPLSKLDDLELDDELATDSVFRDECFSYPYGNLVEVGEMAITKVRDLGYPCAVSDATKEGEPYSRWFLPRFALEPEKYRLHFELSGLKHFIKFRKLLPKVAM